MRRGFRVIMVSTCVGLAASCGGQRGNEPEVESVHFSDVACPKRSYNAPNSEAANIVIKNKEEFEAAWSSLGYEGTGELPPVDFSKGPLLMIFGGQRGTTNEWVVINDIVQLTSNELLVKYDNFTSNHPGCGGDAAISYPFCIVQANTDAVKVDFKSNELNSCDVTEKPDLQ